MQIVILCGGRGTRLKAVNKYLPKGMIEINKKPFLHYLLDSLQKYNFSSIHFCLGYKSEIIIGFIKKLKFSIPITYSIEKESELLGTGGAIKNCFEFLDQNFIVQYGDTLLEIDYEYFFKKHKESGKQLTMSLIESRLCDHSANLSCIKSANGDLRCIYDKKNKLKNLNYVDYGAMVLDKKIFKSIEFKAFDLSLIQERLTKLNKAAFLEVDIPFIEIGTSKSLESAKLILAK